MKNNIIEMHDINKHFGGIYALKNVSFSVEKGTIHGLVGENGAGKSTLMKILTGVYKKDEGKIIFNGEEVEFTSYNQSQNMGIALVPQELALIPYFSVAETIFLGDEPLNARAFIDWNKLFKQTKVLLDELDIKLNPKTLISNLSVSEKQMTVIARILSKKTDLIIMDEPTARLGHLETEHLLEYLKYLREQGKTIIYISHRLDEIFEVCDNITVLRDGQTIETRKTSDLTRNDLVKLMVNREVGEKFRFKKKSETNIEENLFSVKNIQTSNMDIKNSFDVKKGEVLGIFGLVGAGRSEMVRSALGIDKKAGGEVYLNGEKLKINHYHHAIKHGLIYASEDRRREGFVPNLSLRFNISLGVLKDYAKYGFINFKNEKKDVQQKAKELNVRASSIEQKASELSGGNQQKVVLSRCLMHKIQLLFLDEPTRGIDVGAKSEIYKIINYISNQGTSIVIISSEIPELQSICDRIMVMREGKIVAELNPDEFSNAENVLAEAL